MWDQRLKVRDKIVRFISIYSALWAQLAALQAGTLEPSAPEQVLDVALEATSDVQIAAEPMENENTADWEDLEPSVPVIPVPTLPRAPGPIQAKALQAYISWTALLPRLTEHLATFRLASRGQVPPFAPASIRHTCTGSCTQTTTLKLCCLYIYHVWDHFNDTIINLYAKS